MTYKEYVEKQQREDNEMAIKKSNEKEQSLIRKNEISYREYKLNQSKYQAIPGTYNKKTKTIYVSKKSLSNGKCKICGTYCFGDCLEG